MSYSQSRPIAPLSRCRAGSLDQNDESGKDYGTGLKEECCWRESRQIFRRASRRWSDPAMQISCRLAATRTGERADLRAMPGRNVSSSDEGAHTAALDPVIPQRACWAVQQFKRMAASR
ncbi:hypothetical protein [Bradyrhizobium sp.]|uniref:hypothetical protein n=1 Tax=Bradyrhizobium sp. TaxID=376 RepID=UPI001ED6D0A1|nr:hypothetical protein [Bradyrhizobium sp.]MBV8917701.1 hypothetical protein [Bradyrhizobium sp.]MBV9984257.1 hypothetical protein [Bradyrhizobium sp.]